MVRRGHGEGSIFKRQDGRWAASLTLEGTRRKSFYGKTRKEVQQKLTEALRAQQQGRLAHTPRQTVAQYLERWLEDVASTRVRPTTHQFYVHCIGRVLPHIGHIRLEALRPTHIQNCNAELLKRLSPNSVLTNHVILKNALNQAVRWDLIARNPADGVAAPRVRRHEMTTLTAKQAQILFDHAEGTRWHALWVLLVTTGIRAGEAAGLRWSDLDEKEKTLVIQRAVVRLKGKGVVISEPKTERSRRTVHLTDYALRALRCHRILQEQERLKAEQLWEEHGLIFPSIYGRPLDRCQFGPYLHRTLRAASLPIIRVHDLRHTAATLLLEQGVHPKIVQELLGHASITMTLSIYSHVTPTMHQMAAVKMDQLFSADDEATKESE